MACFFNAGNCSGSNNSNSRRNSICPIKNWQESWTASQAQGTAVALAVQDCVVLFLRSPSTNVYRPQIPTVRLESSVDKEDETLEVELHGLPVEMVDREDPIMMVQYAPPWFAVGSHSICAMTGLAMDVEHLIRVLQKRVDDHYNLFQKSLTTHVMTQGLATVLQSVCLFAEGRPYGVQALLVGCDDIDDTISPLCIYSIDPSGSWQSWGRATAIGKYALEVRQVLARNLRRLQQANTGMGGDQSIRPNLKESVQCLIESWKETCKKYNVMSDNQMNREEFEVLILQRDPQNGATSRLFRVPSKTVSLILESVETKLVE